MWCQESPKHVLRLSRDQADCNSWCYPCLMHIHNGLKIAQTLCNQSLPFFFALIGISGAQIGIVQEINFCSLCCSRGIFLILYLLFIYFFIHLYSCIHSSILEEASLPPLCSTRIETCAPFILNFADASFAELNSAALRKRQKITMRCDEWSL